MKNAPNTTCRMSLFFFHFASLSLFGVSKDFVQQVEILLTMLGSLCSSTARLAIAEIFIGIVYLQESAWRVR